MTWINKPNPERTRYDKIYPDRGCDYSPSCLDCPLPICRYDSADRSRTALSKRDVKILELRAQGLSIDQLAREFNLSQRQIYRIVDRLGKLGKEK